MSNFSEEKNENTSKVVYDRNDMLCVLKELDFILCSLHDIASYYLQSSNEQYNIELGAILNEIDNSEYKDKYSNITASINNRENIM